MKTMSHHFKYSIAATHMKNSRLLVNKMKTVEKYKNSNYDYSDTANEAFIDNTGNGILAIYSINATLESLIALITLANPNCYFKDNSFHTRKKVLMNKNLIPNNDSFRKLIELRKKRNTITHWEKNYTELIGSMSYLPIMFGDILPGKKNKVHGLIAILSKEEMSKYMECLENILDDMISIQRNDLFVIDIPNKPCAFSI